MDGPTQKQHGILLLGKGVDGRVGWRAYRYQIIQELDKLFGRREESFGVLFLHFGLGVLVNCPFSPLSPVFLFLV